MAFGAYDFTTNDEPTDGELKSTTQLKGTVIYMLVTGPCPRTILFDIEKLGVSGDRVFLRFSVAKARDSLGLYSRAVVTHEGSDRGDGVWQCSKREGNNCIHILAARKYLRSGDADESSEEADESSAPNGGFDICESAFSFAWRSI